MSVGPAPCFITHAKSTHGSVLHELQDIQQHIPLLCITSSRNGMQDVCTLNALRAVTAGLAAALFAALLRLIRLLHPSQHLAQCVAWAALLAALPPLFLGHFLVYTDTAALLTVVLALLVRFLLCLHGIVGIGELTLTCSQHSEALEC